MFVSGCLLFVVSAVVLLLAGFQAEETPDKHRREMCGQFMATAFVGMILAFLMILAAVAKHVKG